MATSKQILQSIRSHLEIKGTTMGRVHNRGHDAESETARVISDYRAYKYTRFLFLLVFLGLFVILAGIDLGVGSYSVSIGDVYATIIDHIYTAITGNSLGWCDDPITDSVVWNQRLPRILVAIVVGVGLAVTGAAMQSMLKNPLADPYTTGISSGAAFGATIAITLGIFIIPGDLGIVINAFVFGMIPALVILMLSRFRKPSPAMMILAGTSLMYIFNALQQYMMLVTDPNSSQQVLSWTTGSITTCTWADLPVMAVVVALGSIVIMVMSKTFNAMNSGDSYAKSLGINVDRTRIIALLVISVVAAGIVSFTGIIGFIGLVAPHIARIFIGSDNRYLIPASALMGAGLMLFSDTVAHYLVPFDLPIGIVTAIIGGPVFLFLVLRQRKEVW